MENNAAPIVETKVDTNAGVQSAPGVNGDHSASPSSQTGANQAPASSNNQFDIESHPKWKGMVKENRRWRSELESMRGQLAELKGFKDGMGRQPQSQGQSIAQEDEAALEKLFSMAFQSPKLSAMIAEKLGVNKLSDLEKQVGELSSSWYGSQAESEKGEILKYAKSIGLDSDEVDQAIDDALESDPIYGQVGYRKGALRAVFNNLYFDRAGEFRQRAENQKTIEERERLKRGQTQNPSSTQSRPGKPGSADQGFIEAIRAAGGMQGLDFTR